MFLVPRRTLTSEGMMGCAFWGSQLLMPCTVILRRGWYDQCIGGNEDESVRNVDWEEAFPHSAPVSV